MNTKIIKVGFVLLSNSRNPIPSTRISVLNMFPFLKANNIDPHIIYDPIYSTEKPDLSYLNEKIIFDNYSIIYFQKVHGQSVEDIIKKLSLNGIKTIYGVCDIINFSMVALADATIVVTDYLKSLYPESLQSKIYVVHDGIEHPELRIINYANNFGSHANPLSAVLVTSANLNYLPVVKFPPKWLKIKIVGRYPISSKLWQRLRENKWHLNTLNGLNQKVDYLNFLSNKKIQRLAWEATGVYKVMQESDIGIIPIDNNAESSVDIFPPPWKIKSENRLTMKMSIGLPVIATPIPSYEPIIKHGKNGFFAQSRQDWIQCLEALRDPVLRKAVGHAARESVLEQYSRQAQARRLIDVFNKVLFSEK